MWMASAGRAELSAVVPSLQRMECASDYAIATVMRELAEFEAADRAVEAGLSRPRRGRSNGPPSSIRSGSPRKR